MKVFKLIHFIICILLFIFYREFTLLKNLIITIKWELNDQCTKRPNLKVTQIDTTPPALCLHPTDCDPLSLRCLPVQANSWVPGTEDEDEKGRGCSDVTASAHAQILDCILLPTSDRDLGRPRPGLGSHWWQQTRARSCQYYPQHTILLSRHEGHTTPQELSNHFRVLCHPSWAMSLPWQITDNWRKEIQWIVASKNLFSA